MLFVKSFNKLFFIIHKLMIREGSHPPLLFSDNNKKHKGVGPLHTKMRHLVGVRFYLLSKSPNPSRVQVNFDKWIPIRAASSAESVALEDLFAARMGMNVWNTQPNRTYIATKLGNEPHAVPLK